MAFHLYGTHVEWLSESDLPRSGEALVVPANDHLWMLSGPGLAMRKAHGKEIELEAVRQGPVAPGSVVSTAGAVLGFRLLYHAVVMGQDLAWVEGSGGPAMKTVVSQALRDKVSTLVCYPFYRGAHGRKEGPAREMLGGLFGAVTERVSLSRIQFLFETPQEKTLLHETFLRLLSEPVA